MTQTMVRALRSALRGLSLLLVVLCHGEEKPPRPNVILIMADDLAYADLSSYGSKKNRTPVLDQLAAGGMRFTNFYSGATVCTPSRMALLTGCYPARLGWPGGVGGHKMSPRSGLPATIPTIGERFLEHGYRTALIGKWHLGEAPGLLPHDRGFQHCYYIRSSNNQTTKLWQNETIIADPFDNKRLTELFARDAIRFIRETSDQPFFLYLPYTAPHFPAEAHPDWKGKSHNAAYGDVVEELDSRIGEILRTLRDTDQEKNTIVLFLSDNGPEGSQRSFNSAAPHRGGKWSSLEGGTRVPMILSWPGTIAPGRTHHSLVSAIDLFPTLAHACGISMADHANAPAIDGINLWPSWRGDATAAATRNTLLYWEGWATPQAIRSGQWKLYFDEVKDIPASATGPALFDLSQDPAEQKNLAAQHPDLVATMLITAREQLKSLARHATPLGGDAKTPPASSAKTPRWLR